MIGAEKLLGKGTSRGLCPREFEARLGRKGETETGLSRKEKPVRNLNKILRRRGHCGEDSQVRAEKGD